MRRSRTLSTATLLGAVTRTFQFRFRTAQRISSATVVVLPVDENDYMHSVDEQRRS